MKDLLNAMKDNSKNKAIAFFGFYLIFFVVLFFLISTYGDKNYIYQEYEKGNSIQNKGFLDKNFLYDYKITVDGVLYDYYGKRYGDKESFKYNNEDYYWDGRNYYVQHAEWEMTSNPYRYYEFIDYNSLVQIMSQATFMSKQELENGTEYLYYISSNSLNSLLYQLETDYDEEPDTITVVTNQNNNITKIQYQLNHLCSHLDNCSETFDIEMSFDMHGSVNKIDNPIQ